MAKVNSSTFNFAEITKHILDNYNNDVFYEVSEAIDEVSKEAVTRLKKESRAEFGKGEYAKGWARKMEKGRLRVTAIVYGKKPTYQLAHLLEKGHVTRNGTGRTYRPTPAHPHIQQVSDWAQNEALDRAISKLEKRI